jgi:hypothetical protein
VLHGGSEDGGTTRYLKLEPNDDRLPSLSFPRDCNFDGVFCDWFNNLPDLDAIDKPKTKSLIFGLI